MLAWADTRNGIAQHEFTSHALSVIERLGYESGAWDTFIRTDSNIIAKQPKRTTGEPASGGPSLAMADAIFFLGHRDVPIDEAQKKELAAFVRDGKGFVAAHTALTAFDSWPEFGELLGGRYDGHPWHAPGTVINEGADFPATRHFPPTFAINDEFYQAKAFSPNARVLLRLDVSKMPPHAELRNQGFPLAWAKTYGKGRVFYSSFAHDAATWDNRDIAQMYFEAIKWALGMTEGDVTPRAADRPHSNQRQHEDRRPAIAVLAVAVVGPSSGPSPPAPRTFPKHVLAWADVRNGYQHESITHALSTIERLGWESGPLRHHHSHRFAVDHQVADPVQAGHRHRHRRTVPGPQPRTTSTRSSSSASARSISMQQQRADLLSFVRDDGKGFVATHAGVDRVLFVAGVRRDAGRAIRRAPVGHHRSHGGRRRSRHRRSSRHLPASFTVTDEHYQLKDFSRDKVHVLARLDAGEAGSEGAAGAPHRSRLRRSRIRRPTARAACSIRRSAIRASCGTPRGCRRCTSKR